MNLADRRGLPHIELDQLYYGPGWRVRESFLADVDAATSQPSWVLDDFGAPESMDLVWARADAVVWLDLPYGVAFVRAVRRTWRRLRTGYERSPGVQESWLGWATPKHPVILSLTTHHHFRRRLERRLAEPRWQHLQVVRLRSSEQVEALLGQPPYKLAV
ncbi:MAG: hypothetical protein ABR549_05955 [Mycobacteriales bacterium]